MPFGSSRAVHRKFNILHVDRSQKFNGYANLPFTETVFWCVTYIHIENGTYIQEIPRMIQIN